MVAVMERCRCGAEIRAGSPYWEPAYRAWHDEHSVCGGPSVEGAIAVVEHCRCGASFQVHEHEDFAWGLLYQDWLKRHAGCIPG